MKIGDKVYTVSSYMNGDTKSYDVPKVCTTYEKAKKEMIRQAKAWCKDYEAKFNNEIIEDNDYCETYQRNEDGGNCHDGIGCLWEVYSTKLL